MTTIQLHPQAGGLAPDKKNPIQRPKAATRHRATMIAAALMLAFVAGQALAQRPIGIDVSDAQGSINWSSVTPAGATFAWAQCSEGTGITEATFAANMNNGKAAGVLMGAYHLCYPYLSGNTPAAEAAYFWNLAGPYIKADGKTLMPVLDMEEFGGTPQGANNYADWANQWCQDVVNYAAAAGIKVKPAIYINLSQNAQYLNGSVAQWNAWMAAYNGSAPQNGSPWDNWNGGGEWWGTGVWNLWQYTDGALGDAGAGIKIKNTAGTTLAVDSDVFNGTSASLVSTMVATATFSNSHINPCVARTSDGRLELFAVGNTGYLYHDYQTAANGTNWSGWTALSTTNTWAQNTIPAVGVNPDGRLEVFIVGLNGQINHIYQLSPGSSATTNWSRYYQFSSLVSQTAKLAVGNMANGQPDVFVVGTDGLLYHACVLASGWTSFLSLGGQWSQDADIAVGSDVNGAEEVFLVGNTGHFYNNWQTSINSTNWHGWNDLTGALSQTTRTAVKRNLNGRLEAFTIGTNNLAYTMTETSSNNPATWSGWTALSGSWANAKPVAAADQNGALELFIVGSTGNMYHSYQTTPGGSWSNWLELNGSFSQDIRPCVGQNQNGTLQAFANLTGGAMEYSAQTSANSTNWTSWTSLGGGWK